MKFDLETITTYHSEQVDFTPALPLVIKGALSLITSEGYDNRLALNTETQQVIWAEDRVKQPVGCIVFSKHGEGPYSYFWIWLSYVAPLARQKGVFKALFEELEKKAREHKIRRIAGGIRPGNGAMIAAAKSVGREMRSVEFDKVLKYE